MVGPRPIAVGQEPPPLRIAADQGHQADRTEDDHADQGDRAPRAGSPTRNKQAKRKTADRFAVLNAFIDCSMSGLTRVELGTWFVLYRDTRNGTACTSMQDVAGRVGCSKQAVVDAVRRLRRLGLLVRVTKGNNIRGPSVYRVLPPTLPPKR